METARSYVYRHEVELPTSESNRTSTRTVLPFTCSGAELSAGGALVVLVGTFKRVNLERIPPQTPLVQMREEIDPAARSPGSAPGAPKRRKGRPGRKPAMFHVWPLKLCVSSVFAPEPRPPDISRRRRRAPQRRRMRARYRIFEIDTERFRPVSSRPEKFILSSVHISSA